MNESRRAGPELAGAAFGTLGIVFGDIGTSPIYAFREAFHDAADMGHFGSPTDPARLVRRGAPAGWCSTTSMAEELFVLLNRGAVSASRFFRLPADQVFEVGTQVEI